MNSLLLIELVQANYEASYIYMMMNPKEGDFGAKKELGDPNCTKFQKATASSSRQWSSYKNPRIVRASRAFGGKDRHSKVSTVRGLRDRRIRLSVPTAVQLYDLQERLGLSQPSKVVDWLIDATKHEIDKLPPLPMIPQLFHHQSSSNSMPPHSSLSHFLTSNQDSRNEQTKEGIKINEREKDKWNINASHQEQENDQEGFGGFLAQNFFPLSNQSSFPNMPYNNFNWDPPNLSLSQFGGGHSVSNQTQDHNNTHNNLPPALSTSSQLYFYPPSTNIPSIFPPFPSYITPFMENDLRQNNQLHHVQQSSIMPTTLHLITPPMISFSLNENSRSVHSQGEEQTKIYSNRDS
ncbi:hypothetical protein BUALT_Bualt07G0076500 [Buddleja alternifolia]|uniref:TCP domain-containing protein n=1 Tax=Buddleja alternifolia TaxID=168488 RepID=A0AAV6XGR0_9LAMI|nr:hypothetical protein BUALT_Bualt07G0076500 [Buddleja alternifolia]